jgi:hypothetical protein
MSCDPIIRSFEEFDEKLPYVAKVIVRRGINFSIIDDKESDEGMEVCKSVFAIFREMVECTSEMTSDELEHYANMILTACELVEMVNSGLACEQEGGKFFLTPEGQAHFKEM